MVRNNLAGEVRQTHSVHYKMVRKLKANKDKGKIQELPGKEKGTFQNQIQHPQVWHLPPGGTLISVWLQHICPSEGRNKASHMYIFSGSDGESVARKTTQSQDSEAITGQQHQQNTHNTLLDSAVNGNPLCTSEWPGGYKEERPWGIISNAKEIRHTREHKVFYRKPES